MDAYLVANNTALNGLLVRDGKAEEITVDGDARRASVGRAGARGEFGSSLLREREKTRQGLITQLSIPN